MDEIFIWIMIVLLAIGIPAYCIAEIILIKQRMRNLDRQVEFFKGVFR